MKRFCGKWENHKRAQLVIGLVSEKEAICDYICSDTQKPIKLSYLNGRPTSQMRVEFELL
jgi:hypothetical protein